MKRESHLCTCLSNARDSIGNKTHARFGYQKSKKLRDKSDFELNDEGLIDPDGAMEPGPRDIAAPKEDATGDADLQGA